MYTKCIYVCSISKDFQDIILIKLWNPLVQHKQSIPICYAQYLQNIYCEIINNRGVLILADLVFHFKNENRNPSKYNFPIDCLKPRI